jgi:hypothetical protein
LCGLSLKDKLIFLKTTEAVKISTRSAGLNRQSLAQTEAPDKRSTSLATSSDGTDLAQRNQVKNIQQSDTGGAVKVKE